MNPGIRLHTYVVEESNPSSGPPMVMQDKKLAFESYTSLVTIWIIRKK